jgi:hypothetical protein
MKNSDLRSCIDALKQVRCSMQDDADVCVKSALNEAIAKLERCDAEDAPMIAQAVKEALAVLSDILTCAGFAVGLLKFFSS